MKKLLISVCALMLTCMACKNSANQNTTNPADDQAAREKAIADSLLKDSLAKDSAQYVLYHTADLNAFFLHGRVKKVVQNVTVVWQDGSNTSYKVVLNFNKDGKLTSYSEYGENQPIHREKGRISSIGQNEYAAQTMADYTYGDDDLLVKLDEYSGHGGNTLNFKNFNADGLPAAASVSGGYMHMGYTSESNGTVSFEYSDFDENKNYTKSKQTWKIHEKGTKYDDETESDVPFTENNTRVLKISRTITYYTREDLGL